MAARGLRGSGITPGGACAAPVSETARPPLYLFCSILLYWAVVQTTTAPQIGLRGCFGLAFVMLL